MSDQYGDSIRDDVRMTRGHDRSEELRLKAEIEKLMEQKRLIDLKNPDQHLDAISKALEAGRHAANELAEIRAMLIVNFGLGKRLANVHEIGEHEGRSTRRLVFETLERLAPLAEQAIQNGTQGAGNG